MDTCINYCEDNGWAFMSSDERRWINRIRYLAKNHPDECLILKQPEDNGGFIYSKFPQKWMRVNPPKQLNLTSEQRAQRREMLEQIRRSQTNNEDDKDHGAA